MLRTNFLEKAQKHNSKGRAPCTPILGTALGLLSDRHWHGICSGQAEEGRRETRAWTDPPNSPSEAGDLLIQEPPEAKQTRGEVTGREVKWMGNAVVLWKKISLKRFSPVRAYTEGCSLAQDCC